MKIGSKKHRVERCSHARISSTRSPLSDPLTTSHYPPATSHSSRRGVLLLLILALLAMFGLIAVAFVVLTGQAQRSAKSIERIDLAMDPPKNLLHQAAMQVFRGTNNTSSVMGAHSLLETMYGNNTVGTITAPATISSVAPACSGQLLEITTSADLSKRGGCVLTIVGPSSNNCYGQSTRIVGFSPTTGKPLLLAFTNGGDPSGSQFIVNGVPFSGTGFGWNGTAITDTAFQPNPINVPEARDPAGGANSDYTAADFQHVLLAAQWCDPSGVMRTIPSMHRPTLVRYWNGKGGGTPKNYILRPLDTTFTSNTTYFKADWDGTGTTNHWDVDNDGDGVPDSIWVDLGMPPRATNDGRLYKPLFAILCVDLDGRLNVNAHGSLPQQDASFATLTPQYENGATAVQKMPVVDTPAASDLPRGQGIGPADINLNTILSDAAYKNILQGVSGGYQGRYGATGVPGVVGTDALSANKWFNFANSSNSFGSTYWNFSSANNAGSYGTPPDPFGVGALALDQAGRPVYAATSLGGYGKNGIINLPYEFNFAANVRRGLSYGETTGNNPFSASELERLLRPYDRDATGLPARLAALTSAAGTAPSSSELLVSTKRNTFTTDSWDVPGPAGSAARNLFTLLTAKSIPPAVWPELLPPEVLAGLKMNLNRPFGNGLASTGGIVDNPVNTSASEQITLYASPSSPTTKPLYYDGTGTIASSLEARQLEARYLYVLAMLTVDSTGLKAQLGGVSDDVAARYLAQWAINVVCFRDRNSIMIPFIYNPAPLTSSGWNVATYHTGLPKTGDTYVVWGCKRPELVISEALAFHDRRTEDLDSEQSDITTNNNSDGKRESAGLASSTDPKTRDPNLDQRYKPQGSLFIELFNPWTSHEPRQEDICDPSNGGVDLTKTAPAGSDGKTWPVWRLIIVDKDNAATDPDGSTFTDAMIERSVYFAGESTASSLPTGGTVQFRPKDDSAIASVLPGRYAVIGPGDSDDTTQSTTYFGFQSGKNPGDVGTARRIELGPSQVAVYNDGTTSDESKVSIQPAVGIVINSPCRLNISQPDPSASDPDGYPNTDPAGGTYAAKTGYPKPYDTSLDAEPNTHSGITGSQYWSIIKENQRTDNVKLVYLQRLANPLLPGDKNGNPYRTIDAMPADLTSFNSLTDEGPSDKQEAKWQPKKSMSEMTAVFYARQRGQNNGTDISASPLKLNFWRQEPWDTNKHPKANTQNTVPSPTGFVFNAPLHHTFGYLNDPFGKPDTTYPGEPKKAYPFPWLTWLNRPFANQLELLLVPPLKSRDLLMAYDVTSTSGDPYATLQIPYPHLLSFFQSSAQFHRILDYVGIPSSFVSADTQMNPNKAVSPFLSPFNRISNYREPGRINLNTIYNEDVFNGLMVGGFPDVATDTTKTLWNKFVASRRGDSALDGNVLQAASSTIPSEFAHPFRSSSGWTYTPTALQPAREIDCTLLRSDPSSPNQALFQFTSANAYNETNRNPYFRYQGLARLGNLVTTRSNVYAVWITVGYFEYSTSTGLGQELGVDTGEIDRHRAFYIFDRSIPVGFQRGQDLNVEKAILINRYIE